MDYENELVEAAGRIRAALDDGSKAMTDVRLDGLVSAESRLAAAVASWPGAEVSGPPVDRGPLREEVARLQSSLERCKRLGLLLEAFATASLSARAVSGGYDSKGSAPLPSLGSRPSLEARA
jgi:hypothetical protein